MVMSEKKIVKFSNGKTHLVTLFKPLCIMHSKSIFKCINYAL